MTSKELIYQVVSGVIAEHIDNCPYGKKQYGFKSARIRQKWFGGADS